MTGLVVAPTLTLPVDAATETFGFLGRRGSGKSNALAVFAEELFDAGIPTVTIDPKGDWWGIRSSADGTGPGLPIVVFGGTRGDVDLLGTAHEGVYLADLIFDLNLTCILDVSMLTKDARARFLIAFLDRLYRRHQQDPQVRHIIYEEAHEYIPQSVGREDGKLKEAASRLVLFGRSFGIGNSLASQRSARLHNDVLTQISTLFAMQTTAPPDLKAIRLWVEAQGGSKEMVESLPGLKPGEAWLWSPAWLDRFDRLRFRQRRTFDSGSTPKVGEKRREPSTLADVDLAEVKERMEETIEKAKADDPRELRKRIRALEEEAKRKPPAERVEVEVVREVIPPELDAYCVMLVDRLTEFTDGLASHLGPREGAVQPKARQVPAHDPAPPAQSSPPARRDPHPPDPDGVRLGRRERAILSVLIQHPGADHRRIAILSGYSARASTIGAGLSTLRKGGLIDAGNRPTEAGLDAIEVDALPTGPALLDYWYAKLGKREKAILQVLVHAYPGEPSREEISDATGYSPDASTIGAGLSTLRGLGLADGWRATDEFMEEIR